MMGSALTTSVPSIAAGTAGSLKGAGSLLGGLGGFAGGLAGLMQSGSGKMKYSGKRHKKSIDNEMYMRLSAARRYGEQYGISPLVALGIQPTSTPMYAHGGKSSMARSLSAMGQGLGRMSGNGMSELQRAQIENINAETRLINKRAEEIGKDAPYSSGETGQPIAQAGDGLYEKKPLPQQAPGGGRQLGEQGGEKVMFMPSGQMLRAPAEGLEDLVSDDIMAKVRFYLPEWKRIAKGWSTHGFESNESYDVSRRFRNATRLYLVGLEKSHPPPKGMMYVWDVKSGAPWRVPRKKFQRLFKHTSKYGMQVEFNRPKKTGWRERWHNYLYPKKGMRLQKSH